MYRSCGPADPLSPGRFNFLFPPCRHVSLAEEEILCGLMGTYIETAHLQRNSRSALSLRSARRRPSSSFFHLKSESGDHVIVEMPETSTRRFKTGVEAGRKPRGASHTGRSPERFHGNAQTQKKNKQLRNEAVRLDWTRKLPIFLTDGRTDRFVQGSDSFRERYIQSNPAHTTSGLI